MRNKLIYCLLALLCVSFWACEDVDVVGTADCSLYLIKDNESLDLCNDKSGNFQYYPEGSRRNFLGGIVDVDLDEPLTENTMWYLGIENPDDKDDIIITIEVCALVLEEE